MEVGSGWIADLRESRGKQRDYAESTFQCDRNGEARTRAGHFVSHSDSAVCRSASSIPPPGNTAGRIASSYFDLSQHVYLRNLCAVHEADTAHSTGWYDVPAAARCRGFSNHSTSFSLGGTPLASRGWGR